MAMSARSPMSHGNVSPGSWDKIEVPLLHNFLLANQSLKTLKRLRLGETQAVDLETLPMVRERLEHFSTLEEGYKLQEDGEYLQAKIQSGLKTVFAK
jgi:hypothetical protein